MPRKRTLPKDFFKLKIKDEHKKFTYCTQEEIERMEELRALGLSYQKIADIVGRAKLTVYYHLKGEEYRDQLRADNSARAKEWYKNHKEWKRDYYEKKKKMYKRGELV